MRADFSSVVGADRLAAKFRALIGERPPADGSLAARARPVTAGAADGHADAPVDASPSPDPEAGAAGARLSVTEAEVEAGPAPGPARGERAADRAA